ncbi:MAG TPA: SxtJ family membrane protein, partial [Candidatus Sulfopaludibacter sp.]|nr:SxtJ family membrane protein [Candidatus Sulfopaludibacter sp.]
RPVRWYALAAAGAFLGGALAAPRLIAPVHRAFMRFGHFMSIVLSHVMSAALLLVAFAPARLFFRLGGQDPLALRWDARAQTYWIPKDPPGPPPATMTHQF